MKIVRTRMFGPEGGHDIYPGTDHDTTVNDLIAKGWVEVWNGTWETDLALGAYKATVTTVRLAG